MNWRKWRPNYARWSRNSRSNPAHRAGRKRNQPNGSAILQHGREHSSRSRRRVTIFSTDRMLSRQFLAENRRIAGEREAGFEIDQAVLHQLRDLSIEMLHAVRGAGLY